MPAAAIKLTDQQVIATLGNVLSAILPAGTGVIRGQVNRVPAPIGPDYVVMQPLLRSRLATNRVTYADDKATHLQPTKLMVQLDVHGPLASDNCQVITTLLRDEVGCSLFRASGYPVMPLYVDDARQMAFLTGENQYEDRWSIDVALQINPLIATIQQSATSAVVGLVEVDATYPPGAQ